jgi:non-specific protein-tyrosine kinase
MSLEELTGRFDEWIIGQIPELPKSKKHRRRPLTSDRGPLTSDHPPLLTVGDDRHIFAESHRNLRSALWFGADHGEKPKALLVTSAVPGEGKSTLAANLARTMAFAGARVLLIDADLRRGLLHKLFEIPAEPGFSDLLTSDGDLPFYLTPIPLTPAPLTSDLRPLTSGPDLRPLTSGAASGSLTLLPRGRLLDTSGELLLSPNCDKMLARVRKQFDCVILDSIPVFAADDTTSLAPKVDGVLFVVRNSFTSAGAARHALELLYERQAKILGLVFNRADTTSRSYRYYQYADYYHSAGKKDH